MNTGSNTKHSAPHAAVMKEAAVCGAVTLGPNIDGLRGAVLPGVTGALYPPAAPDEAVAEEVLRCVEMRRRKPEGMNDCAEAGRREFSAETMARRYLAIYLRSEPRRWLGTLPRWNPDDPRVALLLEDAGTQPCPRPFALKKAVRELARGGPLPVAWRALLRSIRLTPSFYVRPGGLRFLGALATMAALRPLRNAR